VRLADLRKGCEIVGSMLLARIAPPISLPPLFALSEKPLVGNPETRRMVPLSDKS